MQENEISAAELAGENEKLRRAIIEIKKHIDQIEEIFTELGDLCLEKDASDGEHAAATDEQIIDLLKKYSRL